MILSELAPVVGAAARRLLHRWTSGERAAASRRSSWPRPTRIKERKHLNKRVPRRRRAGRPGGVREAAHPPHERARRLHADQLRPRRSEAAEHHRAADRLRRSGAGGDGAGRVQPLHRYVSVAPRSAHRVDRRRAQHDPGEHADGRAADAVAVARRGAAGAAGRADRDQQASRAAGEVAAGLGRAAQAAAGRAAADERGAGRESAAAAPTQNEEVERKNREVEQAKRQLEEKARQLALTSKYKSEFLANMSHELRTPLNSLLILAKLLADNPEANLTDKQVEFAKTIHSSGQDLLTLINDILDLSKIETRHDDRRARAMCRSARFSDMMERTFRQVANDKSLDFKIELAPNLPPSIHTDPTRLQQVLKNLLGNAFKFTERGGVTLRIETATRGWTPGHDVLDRASSVIAFSVTDTGIGIPDEKQRIIFEAFQQADASTTRKFGGTGLGLSISREIARLLGGEIRVDERARRPARRSRSSCRRLRSAARAIRAAGVESAPAPSTSASETSDAGRAACAASIADMLPRGAHDRAASSSIEEQVPDDRDSIHAGRPHGADRRGRRQLRAHPARHGAATRASRASWPRAARSALQLARRYRPDAITLDIALPDMEGWTVLDRLKHDRVTRHIPVHIISGDEETAPRSAPRRLRAGAEAGDEGSARRRLREDPGLRRAAEQVAAGRRRQRAAAQRDRRADRRRGDVEITARRHRRRGAADPARAPLRLHGPRPRPARHERLRVHRPDEERAAHRRHPDRRLHRPRAVAEGRERS